MTGCERLSLHGSGAKGGHIFYLTTPRQHNAINKAAQQQGNRVMELQQQHLGWSTWEAANRAVSQPAPVMPAARRALRQET